MIVPARRTTGVFSVRLASMIRAPIPDSAPMNSAATTIANVNAAPMRRPPTSCGTIARRITVR